MKFGSTDDTGGSRPDPWTTLALMALYLRTNLDSVDMASSSLEVNNSVVNFI